MLKLLKVALIAGLSIYCLGCLTLYVKQRDLMFSTSTDRIPPSDAGMDQLEEITLRTSAGKKLYSWYGRAAAARATRLYFHGNGGSVATRSAIYHQLMARGYGVFMLGYPGYGGSEGNPSERAFVEAAKLAYSYLREANIEPEKIVIFGESLGTAVAVQLAAKEEAKALILSAPMSSIREIAQQQYPYVPMGLLLKDPFLSTEYIGAVDMPLLVFHGSADAAIPIASGQKLFEAANEPKTFQTIDGAGHNNLFDYPLVELMHSHLENIAD